MTINRCEDYINHMAQAIHLALSYIDGLAFIDFLDDTCTQQACIMNVLIIGEVATKLMNEYPDFVAQHPEIETVYIIENCEDNYRALASQINVKNTYQLYRDYLDNFKINIENR